MPTYDYKCEVCGHRFELFQSITAGVKRKCPSCGKIGLKRLLGSGGGVLFKGHGFYQTDYVTPQRGNQQNEGSKEITSD